MASDTKKSPQRAWDNPQRPDVVDMSDVLGKEPHPSHTPSSKEKDDSSLSENAKEPETDEDYPPLTPEDMGFDPTSVELTDEDMGIDEDYAYQEKMDRDSNRNPDSEAAEGLGADEIAANNEGGWPYDIHPQEETAENAEPEENVESGEAITNKKTDPEIPF